MLTNSCFNSRQIHLLISVAIVISYSTACTPTVTSSTAAPGVSGCCPLLVQTNTTDTTFIDGFMTFTYDSDTCRTMVTITCTSTQNPSLSAGIVVNTANFVSTGVGSTTFPGTCNANNQWQVGNPPLVIQMIQCRLTQ